MAHIIDCHVLTLPSSKPKWLAELRQDLDAEPVNQHWIEGIDGDLGASRAAGYATGSAPFVSSQDHDDRLMPGTYAALLQALIDNPGAPFAWAGEQWVGKDLEPLPIRPSVWVTGYNPGSHLINGKHVHGVKLYRRELVMPRLEAMRKVGLCCEFYLDLSIVKPWTNPPKSSWPVHVPIVGRLWRQHGRNGSRQFKCEDFERMAATLGFSSILAMQAAQRDNAQSDDVAG